MNKQGYDEIIIKSLVQLFHKAKKTNFTPRFFLNMKKNTKSSMDYDFCFKLI